MLPGLVRGHAQTQPDRIAVVSGRHRLTYADLDIRVSRQIQQLRGRGIGPGSLVGVYLDRTPDAVVALLAALGAGAAYCVIEPTEPVAESAGRLAVAAPDLVLTSPAYRDELDRCGLAALDVGGAGPDDADLAPLSDGDTAYVLYTSGSTGVPKGVMVSHGNVRHYSESLLERLGIAEPLSYAHVTTLAADLGNTCLFLALWTGGTLHLVDDATRQDPGGLLRYLRAEQVDVLKTTPSHWSVLFQAFGRDAETRPELRFLVLGGELLTLPLARRILESGVTRTLVNHYGPTEATVGVAAHALTAVSDVDGLAGASVPIGTALGATRLLVRTGDGRFHDRDATGELYIAGPSVAIGYRGDAEGTAAAFPDHADLGRVYRTGDQVRVDAAGVLEFLGRGDRQVKVGGYRVELGHVEAGLRRLPAVAGAVALHRPGERPALVAAVVLTGGTEADAAPVDLRQRLRDLLPPHMIPDRIEVLDAFPRTGNGKLDRTALAGLVERRLADRAERTHDVDDPVLAEVCAVWRRHLGHGDFAIHDDFAQVGGSSIDAIQVIAELQAKGYQVAAAEFLAEPTAAALAARLREHRESAAPGRASGERDAVTAPPVVDDAALSPAQEWFFRQDFAQPDRWNQALLLDIDPAVHLAELAAAVGDVLALHPLLHTAFRGGAGDRRRVVVPPVPAFSTSALPEGEELIARHIRRIADERQAEIAIADGSLFKAHLFLGTAQAHLLLIGHHLAVDAVSWRIVVNDLSRCYSERLRGGEPVTGTTDFGVWATHVRQRAAALRADLAHWDGLARFPAVPAGAGDNREGDAQAVWFRLSRVETHALARAATSTGTPPHAALLGAFAQALAEQRDTDELVVDVESHGRTSFDTVDTARVVGWLTSTFPVRVGIVADDVAATTKAVAAALADVPHLGIAYGLHALPRRADVCFNYLGSVNLPYGDDLHPAPSRYAVGPVRGADNDRGYDLKLTARIHDGQLVADLSYPPRRYTPGAMRAVARATRAYLSRIAGMAPSEGQFLVEHGSSTGLLLQVPRALHIEPPAAATREYGTVLLTGATGFIGAHLLHALLTRTGARIICLVRDRDGRSAADRLGDAYAWYHPGAGLNPDRVTVLDADISRPGFGLGVEEYEALCREVDAIYHLAADTRLFGDPGSFERHNTEPVRALIRLATTGRPKDLHHVSTLAVCGTGAGAVFSEDSLEVGQRFLNEYERSKFEAERLVHEFAAHGGTAFIYRSGNVTGHSESGRFQRNGGDNRLVQLLRGCVQIGRVPQVGAATVALSPVDTVAMGILEISRSARVRGGTFHVDTHHEVPYAEIFAALRELGHPLADDPATDFATLFDPYLPDGDEGVSLAHFWASRPERDVRYDHSRTRRLLARLGVEFAPLGREWLRRYLTGVIEQGGSS